MNKQSLKDLLPGNLFRIPKYQRGYAWEKKQWNDFVEDLDALVTDENVKFHYTGTVVTYDSGVSESYNLEDFRMLDVVDGQQRLTTTCLYLSVIIRVLVEAGEDAYKQHIPKYLYEGTRCRLTLSNDTDELFHQLLSDGKPLRKPTTSHQKRLCNACGYFQSHVDKLRRDHGKSLDHLVNLFKAITGRLVFTSYTIEEECEIGMTFELMNSRGKGLSVLELLKNYLMHWIYRNSDEGGRQELTKRINRSWQNTYHFIGEAGGIEDQCLRVAWTLYCDPQPKNWKGYDGFKQPQYLPLRGFADEPAKDRAMGFLRTFVGGLPEVASQYSTVLSPTEKNTRSQQELLWLERIKRTGNIANFLPLLVAARAQWSEKDAVNESDYIDLLCALECYAYRVFLFEGKRADAGRSNLFRWGHNLFKEEQPNLAQIVAEVHRLIRHYAKEESFKDGVANPEDWYGSWRRVKYTLFEYELHLLEEARKPGQIQIAWADVATKDSTIEHILPKKPDSDSHWLEVWDEENRGKYLHDIGNLVLTKDNSRYHNFEFARKKGEPGEGFCYSNSGIAQEREIARYDDWTPEALQQRRKAIQGWILGRWQTKDLPTDRPLEVEPGEDGEEVDE